MTSLVSLITFLAAVILASFISSLVPRISINYISILIGFIIGLVPALSHLIPTFNNQAFMYIVAPLIFFEGRSTRLNLVRESIQRILETAILLIIILTVCAGTVIRLTTGIPIALAFLMAALSTPNRCNGH